MLHPARLKRALEALRAAAQGVAPGDRAARDAVVSAKIAELLAEIASAAESEGLLQHAAQIFGIFEEIGLPNEHMSLMGQVVQGIGKTYERLGDSLRAYEAYEHSFRIAGESRDESLAAGCLRRMGRVKTRTADWDTAGEHLRDARDRYLRMNDRKGVAETLCDLASLSYAKGALDDAEAVYGQALEIGESLGHAQLVINAKNNLGIIANVRGDIERAIALYQSCVPLAEGIGAENLLAQAYHNLGMAHADLRQWNEAGDSYERALRFARKHSMAGLLGTTYLNKAEMYVELGDLDMAAVSCGRALSIFTTSQDALGEAEAYRVLGGIFARRSDAITSAEMFALSLEIVADAKAPLEIAETWRAMAEAYEQLANGKDAIDAMEKAVTFFAEAKARRDLDEATRELERLRQRA